MPLRDHFRPPISAQASWEGFHGMWPATMVEQLSRTLPPEFTAEPRVHLGSFIEFDVGAHEQVEPRPITDTDPSESSEQYAYEVLVYDRSRGRILVAAVELVSPANKDRLENRRAFVAKCAALLQKHVCVSIVDLVTTRQFNLYVDLLDLIGHRDPAFGPTPPPIYAASCRARIIGQRPRLETWAYPLAVGRALPILPLWLRDDLAVSLDLEASYEETCQVLRIR
jgi:hypothetical protein